MPKPDLTKLGWFDRTIDNCTVTTIPAGSTPKFVKVQLPGVDGAVIVAWWTGIPDLAVDDLVSIRFSPGNQAQYTIVGGRAGTAPATAHAILSSTHSDTLADTVVAGDILYGNSTPKWARLAKGTNGQVLTLVSGLPAWSAAASGAWAFDHILTVSTTNVSADYSTITAAITAASAGDAIWLDAETYTESITIGKALTIFGYGATITSSGTATVSLTLGATHLVGLTIDNTGASTTNSALRISGASGAIIDGCTISKSSGAATNSISLQVSTYNSASSIGIVIKDTIINVPGAGTNKYSIYNDAFFTSTIFGGQVGGNITSIDSTPSIFNLVQLPIISGSISWTGSLIYGWYTDGAGTLICLDGSGTSGGVWLHRADGLRVKYATIAAAQTAGSAGDSIRLNPGTYSLGGTHLTLSKAITIFGDDPLTTIITCSENSAPTIDITADGASLRNLTIAHTGAGTTAGVVGTDNANVVLENCILTKSSGAASVSYGFWMYGAGSARLTNCRISNTAGTTKRGVMTTLGAGTVTIEEGQVGGDTADIYTDNASAVFNLRNTVLTNETIQNAGTVNRTPRRILTANVTYYVRTDGADTNDGLANTSGSAFLTIQHAINVASTLDNNGYDIIIQVGNGTYSAANTLKSYVGSGKITIRGDTTTPANVILSATTPISGVGLLGIYRIEGFKLTGTGGYGIYAEGGSTVIEFQSLDFGGGNQHLYANGNAEIKAVGNYTISAGAQIHFHASRGGYVVANSLTITVSGTPNFTLAFAYGDFAGLIEAFADTFSGSATGKRYNADTNAVVHTNGGGASYFPGNAAGTTATGGQYA